MSKTRLFKSVKALDLDAVTALLEARPGLHRVKDDRGRNALHLLCSLESNAKTRHRSLELARYLLKAGFDVNAPAFVDGAFQATPLWYTISRGRDLDLARLLLKNGSTPEFCLWAAGHHDDVAAIDLLVGHGAGVDPVAEDETPFLGAIKWSRFAAAERLLHHGADVNFQNSKGVTALHLLVKKQSDRRHIEMLLRYGADPSLRSKAGESPLSMVQNRRDQTYFTLFSQRPSQRAKAARARP